MVEKLYDEVGNLAVLISTGYGAGWSTWNQRELAYDKRVIEKWLSEPTEDEMKEYLESIGYHDVYMGGYENLYIVWIPPHTVVKIEEYDGFESIDVLTPNTEDFIISN